MKKKIFFEFSLAISFLCASHTFLHVFFISSAVPNKFSISCPTSFRRYRISLLLSLFSYSPLHKLSTLSRACYHTSYVFYCQIVSLRHFRLLLLKFAYFGVAFIALFLALLLTHFLFRAILYLRNILLLAEFI